MSTSQTLTVSTIASIVAIVSAFISATILVKDVEAKALLAEQKVTTVEVQLGKLADKMDSVIEMQSKFNSDMAEVKAELRHMKGMLNGRHP
jgi:hypothetical protein